MAVNFRLVTASDVEHAFQLESQGYPEDEAASLEKLKHRQKVAPELFLGAYFPSTQGSILIGFVVSTLTLEPSITKESMSVHEPDGTTVCIHSICVDKKYRRQGIALKLLKEHIRGLDGRYAKVALISHEYLIPLYQKAGFILKGESKVRHGKEKWFDLILDLGAD
ncbi:hypothetical protein G9A89_020093 [Geosiphon pyriformis]|nr:hypothetical protein G9A89_020093 [Geosiphon pyriformis]